MDSWVHLQLFHQWINTFSICLLPPSRSWKDFLLRDPHTNILGKSLAFLAISLWRRFFHRGVLATVTIIIWLWWWFFHGYSRHQNESSFRALQTQSWKLNATHRRAHTNFSDHIETQNTKANREPKEIENNPQRLVTKHKSRANRVWITNHRSKTMKQSVVEEQMQNISETRIVRAQPNREIRIATMVDSMAMLRFSSSKP